jgi:phage shock protein B
MDDNQTAVAIVAIVFAPAVLFVMYLFRGLKSKREAAGADGPEMRALMATAERMERRIESLEMLLDSELPGWRSRSRNP